MWGVALLLVVATPRTAYCQPGDQPLWFTAGRPTAQAMSLAAILQSAAEYGLDSGDYGTDSLTTTLDRIRHESLPAAKQIRLADKVLSEAALRFAQDLHFGRVDPRVAGFTTAPARKPLDSQVLLEQLAVSRDIAAEFAALEPPFLHYRLLKAALHHYRELAKDPRLTPLPAIPWRGLHLGDHFSGAAALRRLLQATDDLTATGTVPDESNDQIDGTLADGVRQFQRRHGLAVDGVLARKTFQALTTPLQVRVRQIELTLERWRWLPAFTTPPIIVNIPQFELFAFRSNTDYAADILQIPVIVGQAYRQRRTPVFVSELRYIVFRPYWDVPATIVRNEMLAPMRRNLQYLARNNLELIRGGGDDGAVMPTTPGNIELLAAGRLRLRQRPGDDNSLGLIKFVMPNDYGVYLHGTPARRLFAQVRRDFSHGCIRLSDPLALAVHVLRSNPGDWTAATVEQALHSGATRRLNLSAPVPVMVLYATALATEAGPVLLFDDIYGHDARLDALLRARRAATRTGD